jgi:hypothetical protein
MENDESKDFVPGPGNYPSGGKDNVLKNSALYSFGYRRASDNDPMKLYTGTPLAVGPGRY